MHPVKVSLLALSTFALSSAAMAHGWERGRYEPYLERHAAAHEARYVVERHEDRYAGRYGYEPRVVAVRPVVYVQPRCAAPSPVVYAPARVVVQPSVSLQARIAPGVRLGLNFGL